MNKPKREIRRRELDAQNEDRMIRARAEVRSALGGAIGGSSASVASTVPADVGWDEAEQ